MKRASCFVAFVFLSLSFILVDNVAGGEYTVSREGFTKEFSVHFKQGNETIERKIETVVGAKTSSQRILVDTWIVTTRKPKAGNLFALQGPRDTSPKIREHDAWELKYPLAPEQPGPVSRRCIN